MSGKFLLDTNIIVYSFDPRDPRKQEAAKALIKKAKTDAAGCISTQVVQESLSALTTKFQHIIAPGDARHYLKAVLEPLCEPLPFIPLYHDALSIQERWKFGFYDALIAAGALALECDTLYSEDFQHNQKIEDLTIVNPFVDIA